MVYYVCPNCGHRSAEYSDSMVHYNACTVVRERPALNVTPLGGRSATDPGPSTTGGGLLFEGQAGAPKLGDPSVLGGAGAGGRDDTAGSGQSPPGGGGDATFNGATAQQS
ncbi:hypothetical protein C6P46_001171 [Rhodotorula mucilaginosa]|uniref:Uncharacterized protein n=1 Tax=Rhodotorula mucilaginosa TaxID=5537 RepID=A0A9P6W5T1_RHOMI|nr:hypothetical protein C6P46_001171 [Rhodotorula mucilaginosa]TKA58007.1 hypothetical protein B0A53_00409 [Rhodotorula sp. CCFEE 5036]